MVLHLLSAPETAADFAVFTAHMARQEYKMEAKDQHQLRQAVVLVAALNLGYFFVEFVIARYIGSVSLFADSIDFLEDASLNGLILLALRWSKRARARMGIVLALILLAPGIATLITAWQKFNLPVAPAPVPLALAGLGALAINLFCARMLVNVRNAGGSLSRAAFLSARNDALANIAIILTGCVTLLWVSAWPDFIVGIAIFLINFDAAHEVLHAARQEQAAAAVAK